METNIKTKRRGRKMRKEIYAKISYYREPGPGEKWSGMENYKTEEIYLKPKCGALRLGFEGKHGYTEEEIMFNVHIFPATKEGYYEFEAEMTPTRWKDYFVTIYNSRNQGSKEFGRHGTLYKSPEEAKKGFLKTWELWLRTSISTRKHIICYPD